MNRVAIWKLGLVCMLLLIGSARAFAQTNQAQNKPNIILCMSDDQGWQDVSYNGLKKIKTTTLDAIAANGIRFNRFYGQPVCSPCRASVMTGRHPNRIGVFNPGSPFREQEYTLAQALRSAGYTTGHFGKWHLNGVSGPGKVIAESDPLGPRKLGFDESFSVSNYFETNWTFGHNGEPEKVEGDGSDAIVAQSLKFIQQAVDKKQPVFAVVWFGSPHVPSKPMPEDLKAAGGSGYYGEILAMDRAIGTLRDGIRKMGIADNTLLVFCSDNGATSQNQTGPNGKLRGHKGEVWEGGIRVPGVMEWPAKIKKPVVTEMPAGVVDIFPTIVDCLGIKPPHPVPIDGVSLMPLIEGKMSERPRPIGFWQHKGNAKEMKTDSGPSAWSDNRYKLNKTEAGKYELYDLIADIGETKDLAADHPDVVNKMKADLEIWLQSVIQSYKGADYINH